MTSRSKVLDLSWMANPHFYDVVARIVLHGEDEGPSPTLAPGDRPHLRIGEGWYIAIVDTDRNRRVGPGQPHEVVFHILIQPSRRAVLRPGFPFYLTEGKKVYGHAIVQEVLGPNYEV